MIVKKMWFGEDINLKIQWAGILEKNLNFLSKNFECFKQRVFMSHNEECFITNVELFGQYQPTNCAKFSHLKKIGRQNNQAENLIVSFI